MNGRVKDDYMYDTDRVLKTYTKEKGCAWRWHGESSSPT